MTQKLFAAESGSGDQTVVLLHGFGGWHGIWNEITAALAAGSRVFAYDLPGHAGSLDWPDAGPAKVAARAILADLEARGIAKAHLVGHSMGGAIAALAALMQPDRAATLTLLAPGGFGEEINGPLLRRYAAARSREEISACLTLMSGPGFTLPDQAVDAFVKMRSAPGQTEKLVEIGAAITKDDKQGVIPRELLAGLTMPVAVAWGTEDTVLPYRQTVGLPGNFMLHSVGGAGHMLPEEVPGKVIDIIRRNSGVV
ncbi:alpha/beta fold hydrolase [Pseudaminobacter arsenicus]|uniref:Alpha/beta fold hydrolase n=1 Tax=Borborobacter arsenicus TaxID=1851146 RepID=A0A432V006_9HYPH|nr:alpha/beta fold hydrolase [Pseudaminobacter arsenicus]RUM95544.1 alpha/beta fold hydrolase [Pseudaminobacter arsenicus]